MNIMLALLKREVLEHSSVWKVPLIMLVISGLIKLSLAVGNLSINVNVPDFLNLDSSVDSAIDGLLVQSMWLVNGLITFVMIAVSAFYALSCLYAERQDQSVLFWRSLPISDAMTVVSKLVIAILVIPLMIIVSHIVVSIVFLGAQSIEYLQQSIPISVISTVKIVAWLLLPLVAWCIFCSGVTKKGPFLLAFVAPIVLVTIDELFFELGVNYLIVGRFYLQNHDSALLLLSGLGLSAVCVYFAIVKRSQRI